MTTRLTLGGAIAALAATAAMPTPSALAAGMFTQGHGDIEFAAHHHDHEPGGQGGDEEEFELGWHIGEAGEPGIVDGSPVVDGHFEADEIIAVLGNNTHTARPAGAAFDFLGVPAGHAVWIAPQTNQPGKVFLGIGLEELHVDDWLNGEVTLELTGVSGPGEFSLYQTDVFGSPTVKLDNIGDSFVLAVGSHSHYFWAFTQPGFYDVTFEFSGTFSEDGFVNSESVAASGTFGFQVIPTPGAAAAGLVAMGVAGMRRRR